MDYVIYLGTLMAIYTTLTVSLNLLVGYTGLLSIAQAGLYGIGAYIAALVAMNVSTSVLLVLVLAALGGAVVSLAVALPALRLRNEYFLIATMGFQIILYSSFMNLEITGGPVGKKSEMITPMATCTTVAVVERPSPSVPPSVAKPL